MKSQLQIRGQLSMWLTILHCLFIIFDSNFCPYSPDFDSNVAKFVELYYKTLAKAKSNISDAQQKQKQQYDKKYAGSIDISTGSIVLLRNARNKARKGEKQDPFWLGPYIVDQVTEKGFCKLRNRESGKMLQKGYNVSLLTLYKDNPVRKTSKGSNYW